LNGDVPNEIPELKILASASGTFKFTNDLSFTSTAGVDYASSNRIFARAPWSFLAIAVADQDGSEFGGLEDHYYSRDFGFNLVNRLNYVKKINEKHTLDISLFTEYNKAHAKSTFFRQEGLDPRTWAFGAGTGYVPYDPTDPNDFYRPTIAVSKATAGLFSYFGTVDYDYDSKYGLSATLRRVD
jgi:hypothetical protein